MWSPRVLYVTGPYFVSTVFTSHVENKVELTMLVPLTNATLIGRITRSARAMTMRIRHIRAPLRVAWGVTMLLTGGCATTGPLHLYSISSGTPAVVQDALGSVVEDRPSFVGEDEQLAGFGYDPFTDHFFLRLAPGDRIRVVDRPARAIKREFKIEHPAATGEADLAIKPSNGHVFLIDPKKPRILEITRLGKVVRLIALENSPASLRGIAYDSVRDQLWVAHGTPATQLTRYHLSGRAAQHVVMQRELAGPLAYDAERRQFYAPIAIQSGASGVIGVFDENGALTRTLPLAARYIDVGPRSLVRVF